MSDERKPEAPRVGRMMGGGRRGFRGAVEKPKDFMGTLRRFIGYLRPQLPKLIIVFILAIFSTVFSIFGPRISGNAITEITNGFIAQNLVSGISKAQQTAKPQIEAMLTNLDNAKLTAEKAAEAQVLLQFKGKSVPKSVIDQAVQAAKQEADKQVETQFLTKAGLTEDQFNAIKTFAAYPVVNTIQDYNERGNTVQAIIDLSKNLPLYKL